jgi:hypothetical protein
LTVTETVAIEVCKLLAQFTGAWIIAKLAVSWALKRYKSEKTWERQLAAYVDAIAALSEMRRVVGSWSHELSAQVLVTSDPDISQRDRYRSSKRRLEEGIAAALLLLPPKTADVLAGLDLYVDSIRTEAEQVRELNRQYDALNDTLSKLINEGRRVLGHGELTSTTRTA